MKPHSQLDLKIRPAKCQIGELCCSARGGAQGSMIALGFQMSRCQGVRRDAERSMGSGVHEIKGSQSPWIQGCMDGSRHGVLEGVPKSRGPEVPMWFSFPLLAHGGRRCGCLPRPRWVIKVASRVPIWPNSKPNNPQHFPLILSHLPHTFWNISRSKMGLLFIKVSILIIWTPRGRWVFTQGQV